MVVPDVAYHITQRGNRREDVFWNDEDRGVYVRLLEQYAPAHCGMRTGPLVPGAATLPADIGDWASWLEEDEDDIQIKVLRRHTRTGRPLQRFTIELTATMIMRAAPCILNRETPPETSAVNCARRRNIPEPPGKTPRTASPP